MDNQRVAKQLVKLAKELVAVKSGRKEIEKLLGDAYDKLYAASIVLGNSYTGGEDKKNDAAVEKLKGMVEKILGGDLDTVKVSKLYRDIL